MTTYNQSNIKQAASYEEAIERLSSGETVVRITVNGKNYVILKEEDYPEDLAGIIIRG